MIDFRVTNTALFLLDLLVDTNTSCSIITLITHKNQWAYTPLYSDVITHQTITIPGPPITPNTHDFLYIFKPSTRKPSAVRL